MKQVRAVYASRMADWVSEKEIQEILRQSRQNNQKTGLTGLLCFGSRQFIQCLEGERAAVNRTYAHIVGDPRHHSVELLSYEEVDGGEFDDWLMGYVPESSLTADLLTQLTGQRVFAPYRLGAWSAAEFVLGIRSCIPTI